MIALTTKEEALWRYIRSCERSPTFDEMREALNLHSKSGVHRLVCQLEKKGYISRVGNCSGNYRMARSLIAHDEPRPERSPLSLYTLNELLDEVGKRLPRKVAA